MNIPFPAAFAKRVTEDPFLGKELLEALDSKPPVSVRFHPIKQASELEIAASVPWCDRAFYLKERP